MKNMQRIRNAMIAIMVMQIAIVYIAMAGPGLIPYGAAVLAGLSIGTLVVVVVVLLIVVGGMGYDDDDDDQGDDGGDDSGDDEGGDEDGNSGNGGDGGDSGDGDTSNQ